MRNRIRRIAAGLALAWALSLPCLAQSPEPVGPVGWTARNWIGFAVQITVFVLALIGVCKLADWGNE
jgi:hypothetical protein